ncbi:MAG TPA: threonine ammonia-lyase [Bryobacteraceae bacterium]|nr:threonine ammonia-lyase [Bryobacteraceae bacterium]
MLSLADVEAAAERIRSEIYQSPLVHSKSLSALSGNEVYLKLDNLQMTGSFKERGALNRILTLTEEEKARGVVAASAGNHGQAVAYHATRRGIRAQIWMPRYTPLVKLSATKAYGGDVVLHGNSYDEAYEGAAAQDATFVHAFDDPAVIAGQGSLGLEMLEQNPELDVIVTAVGGGGLAAGVACAAKGRKPSVTVIGVQTKRLPSMAAALAKGEPVRVEASSTLADGIAVRKAGQFTMPLVRQYVDRIVTVEEDDIAAAILYLLEKEKTLAEGAGAIGVAALLRGMTGYWGKKIGVIISGGNLDVNLLSRIIEQGMVRDGRRLRLRITLPDYPGALEGLATVIAKAGANIVETLHNRAHYGVSLSETAIDITMETRGREHVQEIRSALQGSGFAFSVVE